jgi:hypothetical protein
MIRKSRGSNAEVDAKKDVVQSRTISKKMVSAGVVTIAVILFFGFTDKAVGSDGDPPDQKAVQQQIDSLYSQSVQNKIGADSWAHRRSSHGLHKISSKTDSITYEEYRLGVWKARKANQYRRYKKYRARQLAIQRDWAKQDRKFTYALRKAARRYHVSYNWLLACALSEGLSRPGEPFVMNHGGSGAGGWMQFMEGTFYGNAPNARRGNKFPRRYVKWNSKVGQAYTAAYMFHIGQSGQWTGAGCN